MEAYIHNQFVPYEEASLHISDLGLQRGYGLFDFLRLRNNIPLFLDDHLDRFYHSAKRLQLTCPVNRQELVAIILELIQRNDIPDSGIKILLTGGYATDGYTITSPNLIISQHLFAYPATAILEKGVKLITYEYQKDFPDIKSTHYIAGILVQHNLQQAQAYDVLYHQQGIISEMPRNNIFIVDKEGMLRTPADNILKGITRKQVLSLAAGHYPVKEDRVTLADLAIAREAFFTSTTKRLVPVVQVDDRLIGKGEPGPVTRHLLQLLVDREEELLKP